MPPQDQSAEFDAVLLSVWRQSLVDGAKMVIVAGEPSLVRKTPKSRLAQVDFEFAGQQLRGLEQNPQTASRWALLARRGAKVMQFLSAGHYLAVVADGKITHYGGTRKREGREEARKRGG
jgi:hypothetical protein